MFQASFSTDAAGRVDPTEFQIDAVHGPPSDREGLTIFGRVVTNVTRHAEDPCGSCRLAPSVQGADRGLMRPAPWSMGPHDESETGQPDALRGTLFRDGEMGRVGLLFIPQQRLG